MFVWRIARPISARRIHLTDHQSIRRKLGRQDVDDLPSRVPATPNLEPTILRTNEPYRESLFRGRCTLSNLRSRPDERSKRGVSRNVEGMGVTAEHVGSWPKRIAMAAALDVARAFKQDQAHFFASCGAAPSAGRCQLMDGKAHEFPPGLSLRHANRDA